MKTLNCKCCSAPLPPNLKCDYCGTQHKRDGDGAIPLYIETYIAPVKEIGACRAIPAEHIQSGGQDFYNFIKKNIACDMANQLIDCIQFETEYDIRKMQYICRARLKAIIPKKNNNHEAWKVTEW